MKLNMITIIPFTIFTILLFLQIFTCFGVSLNYKQYIGYAVVALMAEVNSIFLHLRQLLLMSSYPKSSTAFKVNSIVNVTTYIVFRFGVLTWMGWWLSQHTHELPITMSLLAGVGLTVMLSVNFVLFLRLLSSDFLSRRECKESKDDVMDN